MNLDTIPPTLPLTTDLLTCPGSQVDNLFSKMWKKLNFNMLLVQSGFKKRSGTPATDVVYLLMRWVLLKVDTVGMFSRESLLSFSAAKKDALYYLLNREGLNWRKLQLLTAKKVIRDTDSITLRAFVVDDSVKIRRSKKMSGISSHFDRDGHRHGEACAGIRY
jgi:hypothetical protein